MTDLNPREAGAYAEIIYGGPFYSYVGIQLVAERTATIRSRIEIFESAESPYFLKKLNTNTTKLIRF